MGTFDGAVRGYSLYPRPNAPSCDRPLGDERERITLGFYFADGSSAGGEFALIWGGVAGGASLQAHQDAWPVLPQFLDLLDFLVEHAQTSLSSNAVIEFLKSHGVVDWASLPGRAEAIAPSAPSSASS